MRTWVRLTGILVCAVATATCADTSFTFRPEHVLPVDADGHFARDMIYTYLRSYLVDLSVLDGKRVDSYLADGGWESLNWVFEADGQDVNANGVTGEGYFEYWGSRGTFTYDPDNLRLSTNRELYLDARTYAWSEATDDWTIVWAESPEWTPDQWTEWSDEFFIDRDHGTAYVRSLDQPDTWVSAYGGDFGGGWAYRYTATLGITGSTVSYSNKGESGQLGEPSQPSYESEWEIQVHETFPAYARFEEGQTVLFLGYCAEDRSRSWDNELNQMGPWEEGWYRQRLRSEEYTHMGSFIVSTSDMTEFHRELRRTPESARPVAPQR